MDSLILKHHNSFQNWDNRKATHSFAPKPLIFNLRQEVWKFNDIHVSSSSPKTDLETSFWNLRRIHWLDRRIVRKQLDIMTTSLYVQNQGKLIKQCRENGQKRFWRFRGQSSCKKSEKSLEPFLRKLRYQTTNQPIITNSTNLIGPRWSRSKKQCFEYVTFCSIGNSK